VYRSSGDFAGDRDGSKNGSDVDLPRLAAVVDAADIPKPKGINCSTSLPFRCSPKEERGVTLLEAKDGLGCSMGSVGRRNLGGTDSAISSKPSTPLTKATASVIKSLPLCRQNPVSVSCTSLVAMWIWVTYPASMKTASSTSQTTLFPPAPPIPLSPLPCKRRHMYKALKKGSTPTALFWHHLVTNSLNFAWRSVFARFDRSS